MNFQRVPTVDTSTILVPGGKMGLAMQLIFTPMILRLLDRKRTA